MPVSCALGQACGLKTRSALGRSSLSPSAGQLGECRPRPLPLQSGPGLSCPSCSRHNTLEINGSRPLSQDLCNLTTG